MALRVDRHQADEVLPLSRDRHASLHANSPVERGLHY
jgi:hypothetical protein